MAEEPKRTQKQIAQKYKDNLDYYRRSHPFRTLKLILFLLAVVLSIAFSFGFNRFVGEKKAEKFFNTGPLSANHADLQQGCQACHWGDTPDLAHLIQLGDVVKGTPRASNPAIEKIRVALVKARGAGVSTEDRAKGLLAAYTDLSALEKMDVACIACHVQIQQLPVSLHCPQAANLQLEKLSTEHLVVDSGTCSSCHREHEGPAPMALPSSDRACAICHNDIQRMKEIVQDGEGSRRVAIPGATPVLSAQNLRTGEGIIRFLVPEKVGYHPKPFKTYSKDHPPFAYEAPQARDTAQVRYNHLRHEQADVIGRKGDRVNTNAGERMACTLCHQPGADGRYIQPVNFEQHCRRCHSLDIELTDIAPAITIKVPHHDAEKVKAFLGIGNLSAVFDNAAIAAGLTSQIDRDRVKNDGFAALQRKGLTDLEGLHKRVFWTGDPPQDESGVQRILSQRALASCAKCHELNPPRASMYTGQRAPIVTPTNIPERWVNHGPFTHRPHAHMQCEDCHAHDKYTIKNARRSSLTSEILMPRQEICAECHRPISEQENAQRKAAKPSTVSVSSSPLEKDAERAARQRAEGGIKWDCQDCHRFHAPAEALRFVPGITAGP